MDGELSKILVDIQFDLKRSFATEEFRNLPEISMKKMCLMRWLQNMSKVPYDLIASQSVPYSPF